MKYEESSSWNANFDYILQTMLAREDQTAREFAVKQILNLQKDFIYEDSSVRARIIPVIHKILNIHNFLMSHDVMWAL